MSKTIEEIKDEVAQELGYKSNSVFSAHEQLLINPHGCNYKVLSSSFDEVAERYAQSQTQELIEQNRELVEMYKECFEMFIPTDKWDEATEFLSTYGSGLAKDLLRKEKQQTELNKM